MIQKETLLLTQLLRCEPFRDEKKNNDEAAMEQCTI